MAPTVIEVRVRVRSRGSTVPVDDDPELRLVFDHFTLDTTRRPFGSEGVLVYQQYPFQIAYEDDGLLFFRPSWAPDGSSLAVSDGLRLLKWNPDSSELLPIPGTGDGVSPAWSPTGEWIAFTLLERADSISNTCSVALLGSEVCLAEQHLFPIARRRLALTRADGSERRLLIDGDEPSWGPNGEVLFFRREGGIWSIRIADLTAAPVPGTVGGREPAISPDGSELAMSRSSGGSGHDIWVLRLER